MKLRKILASLARQTKKPTDEQVQSAIAPLGVKLRKMDYSDLIYGLEHNMAICSGFGIKGTPSVVVAGDKQKKLKILVGGEQITLAGIKSAMAEVGK